MSLLEAITVCVRFVVPNDLQHLPTVVQAYSFNDLIPGHALPVQVIEPAGYCRL